MSESERDHIALIGIDTLKNLPRPGTLGRSMIDPFWITYHGTDRRTDGAFLKLYNAVDAEDCQRAFEAVHSWLITYRQRFDLIKPEVRHG